MWNAKQLHTAKTLLCLVLVYISWGSTFIGNRFCLESFPAFFLCGIRMMSAGLLLYFVTWLQGERHSPTRKDLIHSFILAIFMVFISSGFLSKGQESVDSGTASMMMGTVPAWMVLGGWLFYKEPRPSIAQFLGLAGGFTGIVILGFHQSVSGSQSFFGILTVLISALAWVVGSFYSKSHAGETKLSVMRNSGVLMFLGGFQAMLFSVFSGEAAEFSTAALSLESVLSLIYLIIFGAIIAYTCYFWLLIHTRTVVAISYEFVNPVIGVFLGWLLANEHIDTTIVFACLLMVSSVFLVIQHHEK